MENKDLVQAVQNNVPHLKSKDGLTSLDERVVAALHQVDRRRLVPEIEVIVTRVDRGVSVSFPSFSRGTFYLDHKECQQLSNPKIAEPGSHSLQLADFVYFDRVFPIKEGQSCIQPTVAALMMDLLELKPGMKVLEVGMGYGYTTALAAELVGVSGKVYAVEIDAHYAEIGASNLKSYIDSGQVEVVVRDGSLGLREQAPFDRIYFSIGVNSLVDSDLERTTPKPDAFNPEIIRKQLAPEGILVLPVCGSVVKEVYHRGELERREKYHGIGFFNLQGQNTGKDIIQGCI